VDCLAVGYGVHYYYYAAGVKTGPDEANDREVGDLKFWTSIIIVLILDQLSKLWLAGQMVPGQNIHLIKGVLTLTYVRNRGAAFGILQGQARFFLIMAATIIIILVYYNLKDSLLPWLQYATGFIVGGSIGNMIDRLYYGAVRDFFSIGWWPVFNVADMAVVTGGIMLAMYLLLNNSGPERR
jgi:signal peptidase II